jgi:hypothetical protein
LSDRDLQGSELGFSILEFALFDEHVKRPQVAPHRGPPATGPARHGEHLLGEPQPFASPGWAGAGFLASTKRLDQGTVVPRRPGQVQCLVAERTGPLQITLVQRDVTSQSQEAGSRPLVTLGTERSERVVAQISGYRGEGRVGSRLEDERRLRQQLAIAACPGRHRSSPGRFVAE